MQIKNIVYKKQVLPKNNCLKLWVQMKYREKYYYKIGQVKLF